MRVPLPFSFLTQFLLYFHLHLSGSRSFQISKILVLSANYFHLPENVLSYFRLLHCLLLKPNDSLICTLTNLFLQALLLQRFHTFLPANESNVQQFSNLLINNLQKSGNLCVLPQNSCLSLFNITAACSSSRRMVICFIGATRIFTLTNAL